MDQILIQIAEEATTNSFVGASQGWEGVLKFVRKWQDRTAAGNVARKSVRSKDAANLDWYFQAVSLEVGEAVSVSDLSSYIKGLNALIGSGQYATLESLLEDAVSRGINCQVLLAFARASFPAREKFTDWHGFVKKSARHPEGTGKNRHPRLQGLS